MASARILKYGKSFLAVVSECTQKGLLREGLRPILDVPLPELSTGGEDQGEEEEAPSMEDVAETQAAVQAKMMSEKAKTAQKVKVTPNHDAHNAGVKSNPKGFKGVYKAQGKGSKARWRAQIVRPEYTGPDPRKYLGTYDTMELAARAYDVAARDYAMPTNFDDRVTTD